MSLLDDLGRLADTLGPSDVAATHATDKLLGALVKVLDHNGVTVPDDVFPDEAVADPTAGRPAEEKAANALHELLARVEGAVQRLESHAGGGPDPSSTAVGGPPVA